MKVRLTKSNRIEKGGAGVIVDVAPARAFYLLEVGLAVPVEARERAETPEENKVERKTTRKKSK